VHGGCSRRSASRHDGVRTLRLCRFDDDRLGIVEGTIVRDVSTLLERLPAIRWPAPPGDALIAHLDSLRPWLESARAAAPSLDLARVRLRSPAARPGKVIAVRDNYAVAAGHSDEPQQRVPELFLKATSSVAGPGDGIKLGVPGRRVDHEVELAAVIGRRVERGSSPNASGTVAGYCIGIDVTLRGPEDRGLRKSLDGYTLLGPWLVTVDEVRDPRGLEIELAVGSDVRQRGNTAQMRHSVDALIAAAAAYMTLHPGDVIMTGTPPGVGPLAAGDAVHCAIERIGAMSVDVR
jgi:2-keto-4-pentenoate hydratase/2-oxohepta-3-ene-1,7-dioic acid hydratase in catechol pathway